MSDENKTETASNEIVITAEPEEKTPAPAQPVARKLTRGRDVLFVASRDAVHQGLEPGVEYPAKVVRVWSESCATIAVFSESPQFPIHVVTSASRDDAGAQGTWHWPVLV